MLAALLPLIPLLASVAPRIAERLGGEDAEVVAHQVVDAVRTVAGSADKMAVAVTMADLEQRGRIALELARTAAERERVSEEVSTSSQRGVGNREACRAAGERGAALRAGISR